MNQTLPLMTEAEYLAWEERQELKHEFDGFRPIAMTGGTVNHDRIQGNLIFLLKGRLRGGRCEPFGPNMRVPTGRGRYRYPDALVTCSPLQGSARDIDQPVVIFEIASDSTAHTDRGAKLVEYRDIPSLLRYVMLEQATRQATVISRVDDHWRIDLVRSGEVLALPEIAIEFPLDELYLGLDPEPL